MTTALQKGILIIGTLAIRIAGAVNITAGATKAVTLTSGTDDVLIACDDAVNIVGSAASLAEVRSTISSVTIDAPTGNVRVIGGDGGPASILAPAASQTIDITCQNL